jgi:hypothetical protein
MNSQAQVQPFVALIEVRDSDGITVYLAWQTGVLGRNSDAQVGLSWIPNVADSYEIRTFVITDLKNPQILTPIAMSTFDVM